VSRRSMMRMAILLSAISLLLCRRDDASGTARLRTFSFK
jgi:hypothetical protein